MTVRRQTWFAIVGTALAAVFVYALVCRHSGSSTAENTPTTQPQHDRAGLAVRHTDRVTAASIEYDDDPRGDQRLEGQVIDDNEAPVGGASVVLDSHPPLEAITETDGSFAFEHLTARTYQVEARTGDRVAGPVAVRLTATSAPVVLRLRRATRVTVDVRSAHDDRPIAGALVEVRSLAIASALTDDKGRATLRAVRGGWHVLHVTAAGYASTSKELAISELASGEITTVVRLSEGVAVDGTVVGVDGSPIEGARVVAEPVSRWDDGSDVSLDGVLSDAKGRWRLGGLPKESLRLVARRAGYAPGATPPVPLADGGERTGIVITLERGARLTGRTVDKTGAAVPGAEVRVLTNSNTIRRASCDRDGRFAIDGLPRMRVHVAAFGDGGSSQTALVDLQHGDKDITLALSATSSIAGVVVTPKGERVAEARVVAVPRATDDQLQRVDARLRGQLGAIADDDGGFTLAGLVPGEYHLRAIRPGAPSALLEMKQGVLVETGATDARVVVDDLGQIRGTLAFADGGAPSRVSARLGVEPPRWFDGASFTLTNVPAGKNYLKLDGPELVAAAVSDVEVPAGGTADLGTIRVVRGREISGRVVDAHGQPVAAASVVLARKLEADGNDLAPSVDNQPDIVLSGGDGRFAIRGVGPASQVIVADHQDVGRSQAVAIPAGTANLQIELALESPGAVQGFVRADNEPVEAFVMLRPRTSGNSDFMISTGPDGSYRFDRIAPGRYILYGSLRRGTQTGGSDGNGRAVTVEPGRVLDADLDLTRVGVKVTLAIGTPASVEYGYGILGHAATDVPIPHTISEARALAANIDQLEVREGMIVENRQIELSPIRLGRQLACITPLRGNPSDPAVLAELQSSQLDQPIYCKYVTITTEGQLVVVDVAPPPPAQ